MLRPLKEPKRRRARFHAYDLEWFPGTLQLRLIGVKDAVKHRRYRAPVQTRLDKKDRDKIAENNRACVEAFLDAELTTRTRGDWFYAHAGGLADIQFLLEYLIDHPNYRIEAAFSGSSAVRVRIRRGDLQWIFLDSLFTLKAPLAKIGELLGPEFKKGDVSWDAPIEQIEPYNEQDCSILFEGLRQFEDVLIEQGSELRTTLASCAMRLFRRRYLKEPIRTHQVNNQRVRPAYVGGRVEVFYRKPIDDWLAGQQTPGVYLDVNSCYPWAMTQAMPERMFTTLTGRLPDAREGECCYFAELEVDVPEDTIVPVLPYVHEGSLYFPTGRFSGMFCGPEIDRALEWGTTVHRVREVMVYRPFWDLARFAEDVYHLRMRAKGFHNYTYKILNNSCYGKFGERSDKTALLVNPTEKELREAKAMHASSAKMVSRGARSRPLREPRKYEKGCLHLLTPGAWMTEKTVSVDHAHVPIAAYVTSHARALLHRHLTSLGVTPYYCDTDGFMLPPEGVRIICEHDPLYCPIERGKDCAGCKLGGLKKEKTPTDSVFFAPKLYYLLEESGVEVVKAKGFGGVCDCLAPLGYRKAKDGSWKDAGADYRCSGCGKGRKDKMGRRGFERLVAGEMAVANRMLRIRELFGRGQSAPAEELDKRHVEGGKAKRRFNKDGTSRPWTVAELQAGMNRTNAEVML